MWKQTLERIVSFSVLALCSGTAINYAIADTVPVQVVSCGCTRADNTANIFNFLANYVQTNGLRNVSVIVVGTDGSTSSWEIDQYGVPHGKGSPTPPTSGGGGGGDGGHGGTGGSGGSPIGGGCYGNCGGVVIVYPPQ